MSFKITFEPLNPIVGVTPNTVEKATASEAWIEVQCLQASDERVTIVDPNGRPIEWQELPDVVGAAIMVGRIATG